VHEPIVLNIIAAVRHERQTDNGARFVGSVARPLRGQTLKCFRNKAYNVSVFKVLQSLFAKIEGNVVLSIK